MRRLVSSMLLISLMVTAVMVVSCAKEEEPIQEAAEVTAKQVANPPQQSQTTTPPPTSDIALRPSQRQTKDIMSGNPVRSNIYTDYAGKRVYFCCAESKKKFATDSEAWMKRAEELGMVLQDAPMNP